MPQSIEQHVHSWLELVPLMAVAFVAVLHWPQLLGLVGLDGGKADWSLRLERRPQPWRCVSGMPAAMVGREWRPWFPAGSNTL